MFCFPASGSCTGTFPGKDITKPDQGGNISFNLFGQSCMQVSSMPEHLTGGKQVKSLEFFYTDTFHPFVHILNHSGNHRLHINVPDPVIPNAQIAGELR